MGIRIDCRDGTQQEVPDQPLPDGGYARERQRNEINQQLAVSDLEFARVLEDVIAVLAQKGIMTEQDLPMSAQQKLTRRRDLRNQLKTI